MKKQFLTSIYIASLFVGGAAWADRREGDGIIDNLDVAVASYEVEYNLKEEPKTLARAERKVAAAAEEEADVPARRRPEPRSEDAGSSEDKKVKGQDTNYREQDTN